MIPTILTRVVQDDLWLLQMSHDSTDGVVHVRSNIVRIDSTKTGGMKINQIVELGNDLLHQLVCIDLRCKAIFLAGEIPVEILSISKFAGKFEVSGNVNTRDSNDGSGQFVNINVRHNTMDARDTIQLVSMYRCSDTNNGTTLKTKNEFPNRVSRSKRVCEGDKRKMSVKSCKVTDVNGSLNENDKNKLISMKNSLIRTKQLTKFAYPSSVPRQTITGSLSHSLKP